MVELCGKNLIILKNNKKNLNPCIKQRFRAKFRQSVRRQPVFSFEFFVMHEIFGVYDFYDLQQYFENSYFFH
jgi:hypothetical protein